MIQEATPLEDRGQDMDINEEAILGEMPKGPRVDALYRRVWEEQARNVEVLP